MRQLFMLFYLVGILSLQAQSPGWKFNLSGGLSIPMGLYGNHTMSNEIDNTSFATPVTLYGYNQTRETGMQFNMEGGYYFGTFGMGMSSGFFSHSLKRITYNIPFDVKTDGDDLKGIYAGIGPDFQFGKGSLQAVLSFRTGMIHFSQADTLRVIYEESSGHSFQIRKSMIADKKSLYASAGIKMVYSIGKKVSVFSQIDYFKGLGNIGFDEQYYKPFDVDNNNKIDVLDVSHFTRNQYLIKETKFYKPDFLYAGIGITVQLGGQGTSASKKDKKKRYTIREGGRTVFPNWRVNDSNQPGKPREIILRSPADGEQFNSEKPLKNFQWEIMGKPFSNPVYIVEVKGKDGVYTARTRETSVRAKEVFKEIKPSGKYMWRVVEQNTGESSGNATFYWTDCDVQLSISNVSIECLGYKGENRQYKVCFDVTYQSSLGNLTYNNTGSGLNVYDQNYNSLSYTLTGSNTTLQPQTSGSTVSYCFETTVGNGVSEINFALQGDDLNPDPYVECKPGVNNGIRELPDCTCDDCEKMEIRISENTVNQNPNNPSVFEINGSLQVNTPVYAVEMQIVSWNFSATPNTCSAGATPVENSGMFIQNGTTVNNSSSIQFFNEQASSGGNTNNNISKDIKYEAGTPMNGNIPFTLQIGLPKPLNGLDSSCCQLDYTVCIRFVIYYEDGTCKTCDKIKCFSFSNN